MEEEGVLLDLDTALSVAHFRNSCKTTAGRTYSCAVDCFLEICYRLLLPEIQSKVSFEDSSDFFNLLQISGSMEIPFESNNMKSNAFRLLDEIREPIWSRIITNCGTFTNRNCSAAFQEIFTSDIFKKLSDREKDFFETSYVIQGTCNSCGSEMESRETGNIVSILSHIMYPEINTDTSSWPNFVTNSLCPSSEIRCDTCSVNIPAQFQAADLPNFLLIEFSTPMCINNCRFFEDILVKENSYKLLSVVRNCGAHFACGLFLENEWVYIDDLNSDKIFYENIDEMFYEKEGGWFFAIYRKTDSEKVDFVIENDSTQTAESVTSKKIYPDRKRKLIIIIKVFAVKAIRNANLIIFSRKLIQR